MIMSTTFGTERRNMKEIISIAVIGTVIALGKVLLSKDRLSWRLLLGRGILGAALALVSYPAIFILGAWLPIPMTLELQFLVGVAAALSAMGTEILEKALEAVVFKFTGKDISKKD